MELDFSPQPHFLKKDVSRLLLGSLRAPLHVFEFDFVKRSQQHPKTGLNSLALGERVTAVHCRITVVLIYNDSRNSSCLLTVGIRPLPLRPPAFEASEMLVSRMEMMSAFGIGVLKVGSFEYGKSEGGVDGEWGLVVPVAIGYDVVAGNGGESGDGRSKRVMDNWQSRIRLSSVAVIDYGGAELLVDL
ncbi:hypothetical protein GQ457_09G000240 [Hibiscus cannabinus]